MQSYALELEIHRECVRIWCKRLLYLHNDKGDMAFTRSPLSRVERRALGIDMLLVVGRDGSCAGLAMMMEGCG
jgi:hypothetical protein